MVKLDERPKTLSDYLVAAALASADDLTRAQRVADQTGRSLAHTLLELGILAESQLAEALSDHYQLPRLTRTPAPKLADTVSMLNPLFLRHYLVAPVAGNGTSAESNLAVFDPQNITGAHGVAFALGAPVLLSIAERSHILELLSQLSSDEQAVTQQSRSGDERDAADLLRVQDSGSDAPAIAQVQQLIDDAFLARATDIHIEPKRGGLAVRYRIDGVLRAAPPPPADLAHAIISRVKVLADLDIAETRRPQDGSFQIASRGQPIDVRVATSPTAHGESVVMRLLGRAHIDPELPKLGFSGANRAEIERAMAEPNGIVLVTGPTGSGKSTTLYAMINRLNSGDRKILTIEDPVEYEIDNVNQVEANEKIGLNFAAALRSFLRQDPDIMMVGEIRDLETADIAVRAALTGHMVLSTLHTNSALATVARLVDIGVEPSLIAATVRIIIAQRLVRRLCGECKITRPPTQGERERLQSLGAHTPPSMVAEPVGCPACGGSGYLGRIAIAELLRFTPRFSAAVEAREPEHELEKIALSDGFVSLSSDGIEKIDACETTLDEVVRVVRASER